MVKVDSDIILRKEGAMQPGIHPLSPSKLITLPSSSVTVSRDALCVHNLGLLVARLCSRRPGADLASPTSPLMRRWPTLPAQMVAAAAAQFGQMAVQLGTRLYDYSKDVVGFPEPLKEIQQRLNLLNTCMDDIGARLNQSPADLSDAGLRATQDFIASLQSRASKLEAILDSYLQKTSDGNAVRLAKAFSSLAKDERIATLADNMTESDLMPKTVILQGMGGQGKTQLVLEYCRTSANKTCLAIAGISGAQQSTDTNASVTYTLNLLASSPVPWLVVFDNYDDPTAYQLRKFFPASGMKGHILVTTRHPDASRLGSMIDVKGMKESEALDLLFARSCAERNDEALEHGKCIVHRLGYLPLAIDQAGSYLNERRDILPIADFMDHYENRAEEVLRSIPDAWEYVGPDEATRHGENGSLKVSILTCLAFFATDDISEALFRSLFARTHQNDGHQPHNWTGLFVTPNGTWSTDCFGSLMAEFRKYSLISNLERGTDGLTYLCLHPLVRDWIMHSPAQELQWQAWLVASDILGHFLAERQVALFDGSVLGFRLSEQEEDACTEHAFEWYGQWSRHKRRVDYTHRSLQGHKPLRSAELMIGIFLSDLRFFDHSERIFKWLVDAARERLDDLDHSQITISCFAGSFLTNQVIQDAAKTEAEAVDLARENVRFWKNVAADQDLSDECERTLARVLAEAPDVHARKEAESLCRGLLQRTDGAYLHTAILTTLYHILDFQVGERLIPRKEMFNIILQIYKVSSDSGGESFRHSAWFWDLWKWIISDMYMKGYTDVPFGLSQEQEGLITGTFGTQSERYARLLLQRALLIRDLEQDYTETESLLLAGLNKPRQDSLLHFRFFQDLGILRYLQRRYVSAARIVEICLSDVAGSPVVSSHSIIFELLDWLNEICCCIPDTYNRRLGYCQALTRLAQNLPDSDPQKTGLFLEWSMCLSVTRAMQPYPNHSEVLYAVQRANLVLEYLCFKSTTFDRQGTPGAQASYNAKTLLERLADDSDLSEVMGILSKGVSDFRGYTVLLLRVRLSLRLTDPDLDACIAWRVKRGTLLDFPSLIPYFPDDDHWKPEIEQVPHEQTQAEALAKRQRDSGTDPGRSTCQRRRASGGSTIIFVEVQIIDQVETEVFAIDVTEEQREAVKSRGIEHEMLAVAVFVACVVALATAQSNTSYDYVIAGGGTAGTLLAVVLSENPDITVCVLEAGGDGRKDNNITNPELRGTIQHTQYDWQFWTLPQPGLDDNGTAGAQPVPRGKALGGTSAMNWMIHNTDSRVQLDLWESVLNLTGWNWQTLSTAFRESETMYAPPANTSQFFNYDAEYHGGNGYIQSVFQRSVMNLFPQYLNLTLVNAGYRVPSDRNGGDAVGGGFLPLAIEPSNYTRSYSGSVYTGTENRPNLHVFTNSQVTGIDWVGGGSNGTATASGLRYVNRGSGSNTTQHVQSREVILSAGCIQSSQTLELSGVGDPNILTPLGIPVKVNLANVGVGLRDPPMMNYLPISFGLNKTLTGNEYIQNYIQLESARDMLSEADYAAASAWLNSTGSIPGVTSAQLAVFKTLWFANQPLIEMAWQFKTANVTPYNLIPLSQGTVHINSSDPLVPPAIDPNYNRVNATINGTEVEWDMWFLAKAAQYYETKLATTAPMRDIVTSTDPRYDLPFDEYFDVVKQRTGSSQHLTGGNPMLAREDGGVVDTNLLVYGTSNVRIVDGSVFPYQPSAHPMGLTYALAVRAARLFQQMPGGGGLTMTDQLPQSNASASATATFGGGGSQASPTAVAAAYARQLVAPLMAGGGGALLAAFMLSL
ncbi:Uu.00g115650.m01.CDS01 [Anthostomella pinea]|uniref:Uu.00g115650.m01.CDS01 n=1 Tax=Anthostomella pinea TaxID=933095 RepID=A0AAI8YGS4_9PEZI|nr:Uu.00g115650.m01.CDS01 [Anthostomella pinea]